MHATALQAPQRHPITVSYTTQFRVRDLSRIEVAALPGLSLNLDGLF